MARSVLFLLGAGAIGWGLLCFFGAGVMPDWMGLAGPHEGERYIESLGLNVGLWPALGIFAILGAFFKRLRLAAALAFLVCAAGMAGGRIIAMVNGAEPGVYTGAALALEVAIVVAAAAAYITERRRLGKEAKEEKRAQKAALEAALAAEHEQRSEPHPPPLPTGRGLPQEPQA